MRIGIVGVPGAGKTSTARMLAAMLRKENANVELVSEYARRYLSVYGSIDSVQEQFRILQKQIQWEDSVKGDIIITDSPIFLGFLYSLDLKNPENVKDALWLNDIFKQMSKYNVPPRYDLLVHLPPKLKPVKDGVRAEHQFTDEWRNKADQELVFICTRIFPPKKFVTIEETDIYERCKKVLDILPSL